MNDYSGITTITGGVLRLNSVFALPGGLSGTASFGSNLTFNGSGGGGGVLGLGFDDFRRPLGGGFNGVQWTGNGGFAAYGADRNVNMGGEGSNSCRRKRRILDKRCADSRRFRRGPYRDFCEWHRFEGC